MKFGLQLPSVAPPLIMFSTVRFGCYGLIALAMINWWMGTPKVGRWQKSSVAAPLAQVPQALAAVRARTVLLAHAAQYFALKLPLGLEEFGYFFDR